MKKIIDVPDDAIGVRVEYKYKEHWMHNPERAAAQNYKIEDMIDCQTDITSSDKIKKVIEIPNDAIAIRVECALRSPPGEDRRSIIDCSLDKLADATKHHKCPIYNKTAVTGDCFWRPHGTNYFTSCGEKAADWFYKKAFKHCPLCGGELKMLNENEVAQ